MLDGTHIQVIASKEDKIAYLSQKKTFTINNLIMCDLDGFITYVKAGIVIFCSFTIFVIMFTNVYVVLTNSLDSLQDIQVECLI